MKIKITIIIFFVFLLGFLNLENIYAEEKLKFERVEVFKDAIKVKVNKSNAEIYLYDEEGCFVTRQIIENKEATIYINKYNDSEKSKSKIVAINKDEEVYIYLDNENIKIQDNYYNRDNSINIKNEEREVYPKDIRINKNIVKGNLENQNEEILKVYLLGKYLGEGYIKNNEFKIELVENISENEELNFYIEDKIKKSDLYRNFYVMGYEDGRFKGNKYLTRAEATMMISRLINNSCKFNMPSITKYKDAKVGWYSEAINFAKSKGLIYGYREDGTFRPDENISRLDFAKILENYKNNEENLNSIEKNRIEKAINELYKKDLEKSTDKNYIEDKYITRSESVHILNIAFGRISSKNSIRKAANISKLKICKDLKSSDCYYVDIIDAMNTHSSYRRSSRDEMEIWTEIREI